MPDLLLGVIFVLGVAVSLAASWMLVVRLERVGARLGVSEALLGMLAALAADAPEITAAISALVNHDQHIGAGVVIGSNIFNLAALLGLSAVVAGQVALHPRVIELGGVVALWICGATLAVVTGAILPLIGLVVALAVFVPYLVALGLPHQRLARLRVPVRWTGWLVAAITEEELELEVAIHPRRGGARDAMAAAVALAVVVGASVAMERAASRLGTRHEVPGILIGGLLLAAVTSLPNAVAAVYLASRGRGAAVLSTALNSNAFNVLLGLLLPTSLIGLGAPSSQTTFVAAWYVGMTVLALVCVYVNRGLRRSAGMLILAAYLLFAGVLLATA